MRYTKLLVLLIVGVLLYACGDSTEELGKGYFLREEGRGMTEILSHQAHKGIPPSLLRYGYDSQFIIAEQKPEPHDDAIREDTIDYRFGRKALYYWIIVKDNDLRIGPLSKSEYWEERKKLGINDDLELK